jgi:hypothetical protein
VFSTARITEQESIRDCRYRPRRTTGSGVFDCNCVHKLSSLRRASGNLLETDVDQFGQRALFYDGIPVVVDDFISDTQTQGAVSTTSSIYAVKFGQATGVMGLEHGGIAIEPVGELETKDATRWRVKWYCGLAVFSTLGVARLRGILP